MSRSRRLSLQDLPQHMAPVGWNSEPELALGAPLLPVVAQSTSVSRDTKELASTCACEVWSGPIQAVLLTPAWPQLLGGLGAFEQALCWCAQPGLRLPGGRVDG